MKLFIDSANLDYIQKAQELWIIDWVTTNPTLIYKEWIKETEIMQHYKNICKIVHGDVSADVIWTSYNEMINEWEILANIDPKIVIKIPMTIDWVKAIKHFQENKIKTNCTLVFTAWQAILAAKAWSTYVSPFIGRLDDFWWSWIELIKQIRCIYNNYNFTTQILAASIRSTTHIIECAEAWADVVTTPLSIIESLYNHPLTEQGLAKFLSDYAMVKN